MSEGGYRDIGSAVLDDHFPEVDLALRRGRHIDREDAAWYGFLLDAQTLLETFYRRFGCELVHKSDGYFYLLPNSDKLGRRQLSAGEMLVGQALALLYLDPHTVQSGGVVTRQDVLSHMASVMGTDGLMGAFNPKKKRVDERVAQEAVRTRVAEGLRKLALGGFIEALEKESYRLRSALMRFAEPVRSSDSPTEALRKLVEKGEAVLTDAEGDGLGEEVSDDDSDAAGGAEPADDDAADDDAADDDAADDDAADDDAADDDAADDAAEPDDDDADDDDADDDDEPTEDEPDDALEALNASLTESFDEGLDPDAPDPPDADDEFDNFADSEPGSER